MKRLLFEELLICSHHERTAKKVKFDPHRTLIYGSNETGKSSLVKTIYLTFGATPGKMHPAWKALSPISAVKFSIDDEKYTILRDNKQYAIFDSDDTLIRTFKNVTEELSPFLAKLIDFKLKLTDKKGRVLTPTPAIMFLPFYIDQDTGWGGQWNSFSNIQLFKKPIEPTVYYYTGIRPNIYYDTKAEIDQLVMQLAVIDEEILLTKEILTSIKEKLSTTEFNINIDEFKEEVKELLVQCEYLKRAEDRHKEALITLYNNRLIVEAQIDIANSALKEATRDYKFALDKLEVEVECPTCGTIHENSFSDRFEIAKDSERCKELIKELSAELLSISEDIDKTNSSLSRTMVEIETIEALLRRKKGEIELQDVIENAGRSELRRIFKEKIDELNLLKSKKQERQIQLENTLRGIEDKKVKEAIFTQYRILMNRHLEKLEVVADKKSYSSLINKLKLTGSSFPRALIAYHFSLFEIMNKRCTSTYLPIVIDSPNQQAQDLEHIDKIFEFIDDAQPADTQMILAIEEKYNVDFKCPVVELTNRYKLLSEDEYDEVSKELKVFTSQINSGLYGLFG